MKSANSNSMFMISRYGFDPSYCGKALDTNDCDFGRAVKHLSEECFGSPIPFRNVQLQQYFQDVNNSIMNS